jgi:hypothetical protein
MFDEVRTGADIKNWKYHILQIFFFITAHYFTISNSIPSTNILWNVLYWYVENSYSLSKTLKI